MATFTLPIGDTADTSYRIPVDGVTYLFRFRWNEYDASWSMSLGLVGADPVITTKMVNGNDLLRQYRHLPSIPDATILFIDTIRASGRPGRDDVGQEEGKRYRVLIISRS